MKAQKSNYIYPNLKGHKALYKGKRFWIFEISSEFPYEDYEEFCQVIVYDKKFGCEIAGVKNDANGYSGSLIGPQESIDVSGDSPVELLDSVISAIRRYEKNFAGYISKSTPRARKRVAKK